MVSLLFAGKCADLNNILYVSAGGGGKCDFKESGPVPTKGLVSHQQLILHYLT